MSPLKFKGPNTVSQHLLFNNTASQWQLEAATVI